MPNYVKTDARAWAREWLTGCVGVTIPSFSADHKRLNAAGIRHDIDLIKSLGYAGTLLCAEVAITAEENAEFTAIAREAAGADFRLFFHAAFGTLADNIAAADLAAKAGADMVLLSYPTQFWPTSEQEILEYTKGFCDASDLGVMIFPLPSWGFERIDPRGMSNGLIRALIDQCPSIVAIKAEQGYPLSMGIVETWHRFRDEVVISCPIEADAIPLMRFMDLQFSGTSNTQWMGDYYPRAFALAREGKWEEATELYWQVQPARLANGIVQSSSMPGTGTLNRTAWKYQDWLSGFNGGPLRAPAARIPDRMMATLRAGLQKSGKPVTADPDSQYLIGRHPC